MLSSFISAKSDVWFCSVCWRTLKAGLHSEYCALTSMDLHGAILQATLQAAARD